MTFFRFIIQTQRDNLLEIAHTTHRMGMQDTHKYHIINSNIVLLVTMEKTKKQNAESYAGLLNLQNATIIINEFGST